MCSDRRRKKSNSQTTKAKANLKSSHLGLGAKEEKKPMRDYPLIYFCISRKKNRFFWHWPCKKATWSFGGSQKLISEDIWPLFFGSLKSWFKIIQIRCICNYDENIPIHFTFQPLIKKYFIAVSSGMFIP